MDVEEAPKKQFSPGRFIAQVTLFDYKSGSLARSCFHPCLDGITGQKKISPNALAI